MVKLFFISFSVGIVGGFVFITKILPHLPIKSVFSGIVALVGFEAGLAVVLLAAYLLLASVWSM